MKEAMTMSKNPIATILMESGNSIKIELYPSIAQNTVNNFISLINKNFYNGLIFHRVIKGFMIQGGCPQGTGMGDAGYNIRGEFASNGLKNDLKHERGVISMARAANPNSASSQFFIMHKDSTHLDGQYAAFGKVIEGIDEVDRIATAKANHQDKPASDEKISSVTVELFDYEFKEPEKM